MGALRNAQIEPSKILVKICRGITYVLSRLFWRIEFSGRKNIPDTGERALIIVSNHPTYIDPFWIGTPIDGQLRFLAWDRAFDWPVVGLLIRYLGAIPVSLEKGGSTSTLKRSIGLLRNGAALVIFPEAEREFADGKLMPFRTGAVQLAIKTNAQILPVTIIGGNNVWPRGQKFPAFGKIRIHYHEVLSIEPPEEEGEKQKFAITQTKRLEKIISKPLEKP